MLPLHRKPDFTSLFDDIRKEGDKYASLLDSFFHFHGMPTISGLNKPNFLPSLEVVETDDNYILRLEVPGIDEKDITISIENNLLSISGEKKKEENKNTDTVHITERYYGSFRRELTLPEQANIEDVEAKHDKGVLTVIINKKEKEKPVRKKIDIKTK